MGDIDGDGKIEAEDARLVLRYVAKLDTLDDLQLLAANLNGDTKILADDARLILRIVALLDELVKPERPQRSRLRSQQRKPPRNLPRKPQRKPQRRPPKRRPLCPYNPLRAELQAQGFESNLKPFSLKIKKGLNKSQALGAVRRN